jgi:hypothetical protein
VGAVGCGGGRQGETPGLKELGGGVVRLQAGVFEEEHAGFAHDGVAHESVAGVVEESHVGGVEAEWIVEVVDWDVRGVLVWRVELVLLLLLLLLT